MKNILHLLIIVLMSFIITSCDQSENPYPMITKIIQVDEGTFMIKYNESPFLSIDEVSTIIIEFTASEMIYRELYTGTFGIQALIQARMVNTEDESIRLFSQYDGRLVTDNILEVTLHPGESVLDNLVFHMTPQYGSTVLEEMLPNGYYRLDIATYDAEFSWIPTDIMIQVNISE